MNPFDAAFLTEADDLATEMGEDCIVNGFPIVAVVTDFEFGTAVQPPLGLRIGDPGLSIFLSVAQVAATGVATTKGVKVTAKGRDARMISYKDMGGAGRELICGPLTQV
jgi:hypothetical protein